MRQLGLDGKVAAMRRFTRFFGQRLGALDAGPAGSPYSATEVRVLRELALEGARTVTALSRSLGLDAGYLSRVIRRLETADVLSRSAPSSDHRQAPVELTPAGAAEMSTIEAITQSRYAALVRTLPASAHQSVIDAMEVIEGAFGDEPARTTAPTEIVVRAARPGEVSYVLARTIWSLMEEFGYGAELEAEMTAWVAGWLRAHESTLDVALVAERDGTAVGSVFVRAARVVDTTAAGGVRRVPREWEVAWLHVDSGARGRGIGRRLLRNAVDFAADAGATVLLAELRDEMKTGRRVLHGAEFRAAEELPAGRRAWRRMVRA